MATASPLGTRFLLSQFFTGDSSPASSAATITGISRKLTLLSSHTSAPAIRMMSPSTPGPGRGDPHAVRDVLIEFPVRDERRAEARRRVLRRCGLAGRHRQLAS